jgi:hypothetical protein
MPTKNSYISLSGEISELASEIDSEEAAGKISAMVT